MLGVGASIVPLVTTTVFFSKVMGLPTLTSELLSYRIETHQDNFLILKTLRSARIRTRYSLALNST